MNRADLFLVCDNCGHQAVPWAEDVDCLNCGDHYDTPSDHEPFRVGWDESD